MKRYVRSANVLFCASNVIFCGEECDESGEKKEEEEGVGAQNKDGRREGGRLKQKVGAGSVARKGGVEVEAAKKCDERQDGWLMPDVSA